MKKPPLVDSRSAIRKSWSCKTSCGLLGGEATDTSALVWLSGTGQRIIELKQKNPVQVLTNARIYDKIVKTAETVVTEVSFGAVVESYHGKSPRFFL